MLINLQRYPFISHMFYDFAFCLTFIEINKSKRNII